MKRGTPRHPKVYDLVQELGLPVRSRFMAIGYLELLWHFTAEFAPQGDIGKFSDGRIESAMDWTGAKGRLVEALTNSKWCDKSSRHRLVVHDWHEHADDSVRKRLSRAHLSFVTVTDEVTGQCPQPSQTSADNIRQPLPLPEPLPFPTRGKMPEEPPKSLADPLEEFQRVFIGEMPDDAWREFMASVNTPELLTSLQANTPLWMKTKKYRDGYGKDAKQFLRSGVWKLPPKKELFDASRAPPAREPSFTYAPDLERTITPEKIAADRKRRGLNPDGTEITV